MTRQKCIPEEEAVSRSEQATFVLVPGAWCGGWCWKPVTERLRSAGHQVVPLTLTGVGERSHLLHSNITLETHVQDIINVIRFNDLKNVVLVGHSYAGLTLAPVLDRIAERLRHVVYLDALLVHSGECAMDIIPPEEVGRRMLKAAHDGGISMPVPTGAHFSCEATKIWFQEHLTPHPIQPYFDKIALQHPMGNGCPITYVSCIPGKLPAVALSARRAREHGWRVVEIESGHNVQLHRPDAVTQILLECLDYS